MIVRHFSADGKELKAYLPRSSFPPCLEPGADGPEVHIEVTNDRLGIRGYSGKTSANAEWVELDLSGNLLGRYRTDDVPHAVAFATFTADDHVYLAGLNLGEMTTLDHASRTWKSIPQQAVLPCFQFLTMTSFLRTMEQAMNTDSTLTSKGQTTIPKPIRDSLRMKAGDKMSFTLMPDGVVIMRVKNRRVSDLAGLLYGNPRRIFRTPRSCRCSIRGRDFD
jgi:antitoxin PrlF